MTEYSQTGEYPSDITQFLKPCVLRKKYFKDSNTIAFIWRENVIGYLSLDIICLKLAVFFELRSRKTVRLSEEMNVRGQICEHIFALNEAIVYLGQI